MLNDFKMNRSVLKKFLPDDRAIREFENMISTLRQLNTNELTSKVSTASVDTALEPESVSLLVDASSSDINITLPSPVQSYADGRSYVIGITKVDQTTNVINILPYGSEKVLGSDSETLEAYEEVLNLITDGTNWHLLN